MTQEEKARAYDEALELAKSFQQKFGGDYAGYIFPELAESEDERIRKEIISALKFANDGGVYDKHIAYLEKQKENPKSADSIPSDCMSDVKCEDRWHKTANSLPDNGRDVLAKDALGNYLIASFDGAQWFVSVYDGEDHPVLHTPPIIEWCDIPSETCKESLHVTETCKENADSFTDARKDVIVAIEIYLDWLTGYPDYAPKGKYSIRDMLHCLFILEKQKEQKPAEWSEEDEKMLHGIEQCVYDNVANIGTVNKYIDFLSSLRPSWKPSEEQMEVDLEKASRNVYESWMGGTMNDVRRDMVELGKVLKARKEDEK